MTGRGARWVVLGAGSILPRAGHGPAGYALVEAGGGFTLFDCGPGTLRALPAVGLALEDLERVVLSHYHLDHCLDLFALFFARRNPAFRAPPLTVLGPPGLQERIEGVPRALGRWASPDPGVEVREVVPDSRGRGEVDLGALRLRCVHNGHCPEAVSWRADLAAASVAYSGDTPFAPGVAALARGADLFTCEASFGEEEAQANHLTPRQAGELARRAGVGRLLLTHFYPGLDPVQAVAAAAEVFGGPVLAARDGMDLPLGLS